MYTQLTLLIMNHGCNLTASPFNTFQARFKESGDVGLSSTLKVYAATAKSLQSCLTLCDPIDGSPPGSAVPGILQARALEWVAIAFSNA